MFHFKSKIIFTVLSIALMGNAAEKITPAIAPARILIEAEAGHFQPSRLEIIDQPKFSSGKGITLKSGQLVDIYKPSAVADIAYEFNIPAAGRFDLFSWAATDDAAYCYIWIAVDGETPRQKVVVSPWKDLSICKEHLQKADLTAGRHYIKIWLPEKVTLDRLELLPVRIHGIPDSAAKYNPSIVPPATRPRLMVTQQTLESVRKNLTVGENKEIWESLKKEASNHYVLKTDTPPPPKSKVKSKKPSPQIIGVFEDEKALDIAVKKAFVCLMENDKAKGREAVKLIADYISKAEFGNQLDVCRKIGFLIYSSALVYDWCYELASLDQKRIIRANMMRLAEDMEIGWPPFKQQVINGHGNEAQLSRDLLSMSIAIYSEDPQPYKLCSYRILEELVPGHNKDNRSGRHNQGGSYGPYRFGWDVYAAWIFYRMSGKKIFSADLKKVPYFWIYMRIPDGEMLRDGDIFTSGKYWSYAFNAFLDYTYSNDPLLKGEFIRQDGMNWAKKNAVLFLLLNDSSLKAESSLDRLPLTRYFSDPLGSMICRTGWSFDRNSSDAVIEMKGAGTYFGNHQHLDAGAFQIYYRGMLAADLGLYCFYGTPYDINFNKRSIAHNLMLVFDPAEKFSEGRGNDGGQQVLSAYSPNGKILARDFGPDLQKPLFSYLKVDLAAAYSNKLSSYTRSFCFLNLGLNNSPGVLITFDRLATVKPEFKKYWQINSYQKPEITTDGFVITSIQPENPGKLIVSSLLPKPSNREIMTSGGNDANTVFGRKFQAPAALPEAAGWRTVIYPKVASREDLFLTVMQIADGKAPPLQTEQLNSQVSIVVAVADRIVSFSRNTATIKSAMELKVPSSRQQYHVLLCDLEPGKWSIKEKSGKGLFNAVVKPDAGTLFAILQSGEYIVSPGNNPALPEQ